MDRFNLKTNTVLSQSVNTKLRSHIEELSKENSADSINSLWQILEASSDGVVQQCVCEAIKDLVCSQRLSTEAVLNRIITYIPCCKQVGWIVHLAADLLLMELNTNVKDCSKSELLQYTSPYNLWLKPHPFVSITNAHPGCSTAVMNEFQRLLLSCDSSTSTNIIQLVKPYILYVVCMPQDDNKAIYETTTMFHFLLNCASSWKLSLDEKQRNNFAIFQLLLQSISFVAVTEANVHLFLQIFQAIIRTKASALDSKVDARSQLFLIVLSLCFSNIDKPTAQSLSYVMLEILKTDPSISHLQSSALSLAHLISIAPPSTVQVLLNVAIHFLQLHSWENADPGVKIRSLYYFKASLLQMVFSKHLVGFASCKRLLAKCLKLVTEELKQLHSSKSTSSEASRDEDKLKYLLPSNHLFCVRSLIELFYTPGLFKKVAKLMPFPGISQLSTLLVCSELLQLSHSETGAKAVMDKLDLIAASGAAISATVLPCVLHILGCQKSPNIVKELVFFLPRLIDQYSMGPIIRTIQLISQHPGLKSVATSVMFNLWEKQPRCFPFLHRMLTAKIFSQSNRDKTESAAVNAVIVRDICKAEPHKYVGDMLKLVTEYLKEGPPMILNIVLDAVYHLCANEAVSIKSVWANIKPLVIETQAPMAICSILKLFSLIPNLETTSNEFIHLKDECLQWIWDKVESENLSIRGSCLVSLAHFSQEDFKIKHLPASLRPEDPHPAEGQTEEECKNLFLEKSVPGENLVRVALSSNCSQQQTQFFLTSLLTEELNKLPRDIRHRALAADKTKSRPAIVNAVPQFMLRMYERNKQPNLKVSYATGLLMCHNPQCEVDNAGKLVARSVVARGRNFVQILQALLSEVTVDPKQWHNSMQTVLSWRSFMAKCFGALVESRRTELKLQLKQKSSEQDGDVEHKLATCELSCRDKLTDILKTASKGSPSMQGNAIYALAGLIHAVKAYKLEAEESSSVEESGFLTNDHWTVMAANTIVSIANPSYLPKGRIFSWCQYRSVSGVGDLTTSQLGKSCAVYSLHTLVSVLLPKHSLIVVSMLAMLHKHHLQLFGDVQQDVDLEESKNLPLAISLGHVLSEALQNDAARSENEELDTSVKTCCRSLANTLAKITKSVGDDEIDSLSHIGLVVGLGCLYSTALVSVESILNSQARQGLDLIEKLLQSSDDSPLSFHHALCSSISWITISGMQGKVIDGDHSKRLLTHIQEKWQDNQNNVGLSQVLSFLSHSLACEEVDDAKQLHEELFHKWQGQVGKDRIPTRQKLAAIHGLAGLVGCGNTVIQATGDQSHSLNKLPAVIKVLQDTIKNSKDVGVTGNAIFCLGGIYLSTQAVKKSSGSFPPSFSYLPESSIMKPLFNYLLDNSKQESCGNNAKVLLTSLSIVSDHEAAFPPVNWSSCFANIASLDEDCQHACLQICINGFAENPSLANVLTSWSQVVSIDKLHPSCQCLIYKSLPCVVKCLAEAKLATLFKSYVTKILNPSLREDLLKGLAGTLQIHDLPSETSRILQQSTKQLFVVMPLCENSCVPLAAWTLMSDCVGQCTNCEVLLSADQASEDESFIVKTLFVKLHLIGCNMKTIDWIFVTLLKCSVMKEMKFQKLSLWLLFKCSSQWNSSSSQNLSEVKCVEAMLELVGMFSNLHPNAFSFMVRALAVIVLALCNQRTNTDVRSLKTNLQDDAMADFIWDNCLILCPMSISQLLSASPWKEKLSGVLTDFLLKATTLNVDPHIKHCLSQTLLGLRHTKYYSRAVVWTSAVSNLLLCGS